jgi:hypothetical protein
VALVSLPLLISGDSRRKKNEPDVADSFSFDCACALVVVLDAQRGLFIVVVGFGLFLFFFEDVAFVDIVFLGSDRGIFLEGFFGEFVGQAGDASECAFFEIR